MVDRKACNFSMTGIFLSFCPLIAAEFIIGIRSVFDGFDDEIITIGIAYFYSDAVADFMTQNGFS